MRAVGWTIEVEGLGPFPCEVRGEDDAGLKSVSYDVSADLFSHLGATVRLRLSGGGRSGEGEGLVTAVTVPDGGNAESTIVGLGPLRMVPGGSDA